MTTAQPYISASLTRELDKPSSPVRQFLDGRFSAGRREVQRRYRNGAGPLVIPGVPRDAANPGTLGTAADWLLRFLLHPRPDVHMAMAAAAGYVGPKMMRALADMTTMLGAPPRRYKGPVAGTEGELAGVADLIVSSDAPPEPATFPGPVAGSSADAELLARGCWALARLTEGFRAGPQALGELLDQRDITADGLLDLAPPAALAQLASFRQVFETTLIPGLAARRGAWTLGPTFAGSKLFLGADGDLIAAGLLLDLKTRKEHTLGVKDLSQIIAYALLDFEDEYRLDTVGIFSARYAHLATWPVDALLDELAGHKVSLRATRDEFQRLLLAHQDPELAPMADEITRFRSGR